MLTAQMTGSHNAAGARSARIQAGASTAPAWVCVAARLAWPLCGLLVAVWAISRLVLAPNPDAPPDSTLWHASFLAYAVMGALIVNRRPSNRVGWLFIVVGTFDPLSAAVRSVAATAGTGAFPASTVNVADWLQSWMWAPSMGALVLLVYVFPDGALPPGRWRWGAFATIAATGLLLVVQPFLAWPYRGLILWERAPAGAAGQILPFVAFGAMAASLVTALAWVAVRFRRSRGTERLQLKWFFYGVAVLVAAMLTDIFVLEALRVPPDSLARQAIYWSFLLPPMSAAIAILRHRLYDIDRIINRTVVYGVLTVVLGVAYLAAVSAMRMVTAPITGDTAVAVAGSTLAVAALFHPARRRIQASVDRRFNRARYDAVATIERFSTRLRDEIELDTLARELVGVVGTTMQPASANLWLRESS